MAAAAVYAAPADDQQAALAPEGDREMQALLSMDSFNITSADPEQNRLHAVCDMEYRLSKMTKPAGAPGLMNLAQANTNAASLFNPFTLPLMAVKQHISLLQQEEKFLQAQSDAFSGTSTAVAPSAITLSKCGFILVGATTPDTRAAKAAVATDNIAMDIVTNGVLNANQHVKITVDVGQNAAGAGADLTYKPITHALSGVFGAANFLFKKTGGADDFPKNAAGATLLAADVKYAKADGTDAPSPFPGIKATDGTDSGDGKILDVTATSTSKDIKVGNAGIIQVAKLANGLEKLDEADKTVMMLGPFSIPTATLAAAKPYTITVELLKGTSTLATDLLGKATCTTSA